MVAGKDLELVVEKIIGERDEAVLLGEDKLVAMEFFNVFGVGAGFDGEAESLGLVDLVAGVFAHLSKNFLRRRFEIKLESAIGGQVHGGWAEALVKKQIGIFFGIKDLGADADKKAVLPAG